MGKKRKALTLSKFLKKPRAEFSPEGVLEFLDPGSEDVSLAGIVAVLSKALAYNRLDYFLYLLPVLPYHQYFSLLDTDQRDNVTRIHEAVDRLVAERVISFASIDGCVASDGNCMYAASLAAASRLGVAQDVTVDNLRAQVAERIVGNLEVYRNLLESQLLDIVSEGVELGTNEGFIALFRELNNIAPDERQAYIQDHNDIIDRYVALIRENGVWGGDVELGVIGQILDVQIDVHNIETQVITTINNGPHDNSVTISFSGNHYNTIEGYNIVFE
jgi:hypothetical protein